jgi:hypothetical protein
VLQLVFALVSVGAIALTVNVVLLGGTIGFFQSLCLLGYCLFPMDVAAIVCVTVDIMLVRCGVFGRGLGWQKCRLTGHCIPFVLIAGCSCANESKRCWVHG